MYHIQVDDLSGYCCARENKMIYIIIGLIGAIVMFCGDMTLYYTPDDFDYESGKNQNVMQAVVDVMKKLPARRVAMGGMIGPVAAFLYCIGFFHVVVITNDTWKSVAYVAFFLLCLGIISGGAYHSHCAYLGLLGDEEYSDARDIVIKYFSKLALVMYVGEGVGFLLLLVLIITNNTILPVWTFLLSPGVLFLLKKPLRKLPKGIRVIVSGGWTNLISVIYYIMVLIYTL